MPTQRKKILYIITKSNFGGAQRYVFELATSLDPETYDVVVAFGGNGLLKTRLEEAGIRTRTIQSFERDIHFTKELASMRELYHLIKEERPDIVHLNSSKAGGTGAFIARLCGVKNVIFTAHGWPFFEKRNALWRGLTWFFSYATSLLAHTVIVVSKKDLEHPYMPGMSKKITFIPTGVPPISFLSREDARSKLFCEEIIEKHAHNMWLVSTGELTGNKNLLLLLKSLHHLQQNDEHKVDRNFFLVLMGDGEERALLEAYVHEHGLKDFVAFTGFVADARQYLQAFDVFLLPSLKEGMPFGLLEAGSAGLACIGSNVGGIPQIIEHERTGILINPNEVKSVASALTSLLRNAELRASYGNEIAKKIANDFSLNSMVSKTISLY